MHFLTLQNPNLSFETSSVSSGVPVTSRLLYSISVAELAQQIDEEVRQNYFLYNLI